MHIKKERLQFVANALSPICTCCFYFSSAQKERILSCISGLKRTMGMMQAALTIYVTNADIPQKLDIVAPSNRQTTIPTDLNTGPTTMVNTQKKAIHQGKALPSGSSVVGIGFSIITHSVTKATMHITIVMIFSCIFYFF